MQRISHLLVSVIATAIVALSISIRAADDDNIDWTRAKQLHQRAQNGEKLSAADQAYYERAKAALAL